MSLGRKSTMFGIGIVLVVLAAVVLLFGYPRLFDGNGRWVQGGSSGYLVAGVVALLAAAHMWSSVTDTRPGRMVAGGLAVLGLGGGTCLLWTAPIVGVVLVSVYGYVLLGLLRRADVAEQERLRRHLRRG